MRCPKGKKDSENRGPTNGVLFNRLIKKIALKERKSSNSHKYSFITAAVLSKAWPDAAAMVQGYWHDSSMAHHTALYHDKLVTTTTTDGDTQAVNLAWVQPWRRTSSCSVQLFVPFKGSRCLDKALTYSSPLLTGAMDYLKDLFLF